MTVVQLGEDAAGFADVYEFPLPSTATHHDLERQDSAVSEAAMRVGVQIGAGALGSVETKPFPFLSNATQNELDGHDTPLRYVPSIFLTVHVGEGSAGFVEATTFPLKSVRTHNVVGLLWEAVRDWWSTFDA